MREASLIFPQEQPAAAILVADAVRGDAGPGGGTNRVRGRRSVSNLPVLLAGPILRQCAAQKIMVWVATSVPLRITGRVLDPQLDRQGHPSGTPTELGHGEARTVEIAANLHLAWIVLLAATRFHTGRILTYDLTFHAPDGYSFKLPREHRRTGEAPTPLGLLPRDAITYGSLGLPSFIVDREDVTRTHLMHASCRKLHGPGQDASPELDRHLRRTYNDAQRRPRFLLLTGDQIYADDVADDLARPLARASRLLVGFRETLPDSTTHTDGLGDRTARVREAGLTVDPQRLSLPSAGTNHLLGFGEFAAMYLLSWSPALWDAPAMEGLPGPEARRRNYEDVVALRRALANVATYMLLDDHEITDDWPMDGAMTRAIEGSAVGKWIVANGLAACWLFQLQGNGRGDLPALGALRNYLRRGAALARLPASGAGESSEQARARESMEASRRSYVRTARTISGLSNVVATVPRVVLVDTRTQRHLSESDAPGLLNETGRAWLRSELRALASAPSAPLLIVSPAPVIGNPTYDGGLEEWGNRGARYFFDREAWGHNVWYLRDFLRVLALAGRKVVVFSGDVHHGYTAVGTFTDGSSRMSLIQLTSSAARNHPTDTGLDTLRDTPPSTSTQSLAGATLDARFPSMSSLGSTIFLDNNVGFVTLEWNDSGVTVTHELRGEGRTGRVVETI